MIMLRPQTTTCMEVKRNVHKTEIVSITVMAQATTVPPFPRAWYTAAYIPLLGPTLVLSNSKALQALNK